MTVDYTRRARRARHARSRDRQGDSTWTAEERPHRLSPAVLGSRDGKTVAILRHDYQHPPEIWVGPERVVQLTHLNARASRCGARRRAITWKSDGRTVQGWLLYPRNFDATKTYPMIVCAHGGRPASRCPAGPAPRCDPRCCPALGYFVLLPNPRGSYGQGEAFTRANVKDFGDGDLRDILAGVDEVLKTGAGRSRTGSASPAGATAAT